MGLIFTDGTAVVAFYVALNALILLALGAMTVRARFRTRTVIGDGGKDEMIRAGRAHGNAAENIPITLLVLFGLAHLGASLGLLHILGAGLTLGRLFHAAGLMKTSGVSLERQAGMMLTWLTLGIGAFAILFLAFLS